MTLPLWCFYLAWPFRYTNALNYARIILDNARGNQKARAHAPGVCIITPANTLCSPSLSPPLCARPRAHTPFLMPSRLRARFFFVLIKITAGDKTFFLSPGRKREKESERTSIVLRASAPATRVHVVCINTEAELNKIRLVSLAFFPSAHRLFAECWSNLIFFNARACACTLAENWRGFASTRNRGYNIYTCFKIVNYYEWKLWYPRAYGHESWQICKYNKKITGLFANAENV